MKNDQQNRSIDQRRGCPRYECGQSAASRGMPFRKALTVEGIIRGYEGLLSHETRPLGRRESALSSIAVVLCWTARCLEFKERNAEKAVAYLRELEIDALVVIGGDGSMRGAQALSRLGFPTITIPGTIDNDMMGTQYTLGFDTTVNTVLESVNKIRDTALLPRPGSRRHRSHGP